MDYLLSKKGDIPLIISVPHGGWEEPGEISFRRSGNLRMDMYTLELAHDLESSLKAGWGQPYMAAGLIRRSIIDYNRPPGEAFDDPKAACHYRDFHGALDDLAADCRKNYGACLLVDVHGSRGTGPGAPHVVLGTARYASMPPVMVTALLDLLAGGGWRARHDTGGPYRGGFIVRHYADGGGILGVQLEICRDVRQDPALRLNFSSSLAKALSMLDPK